ncbi:WOC protein [Anopheles darlingi]|uniref:WOC protein n=1 Tax=Anopheles darlingi TaxID=43151 RepID=W5J6T4_ANODA|nr:WOC protein [Anopheles darlingi]
MEKESDENVVNLQAAIEEAVGEEANGGDAGSINNESDMVSGTPMESSAANVGGDLLTSDESTPLPEDTVVTEEEVIEEVVEEEILEELVEDDGQASGDKHKPPDDDEPDRFEPQLSTVVEQNEEQEPDDTETLNLDERKFQQDEQRHLSTSEPAAATDTECVKPDERHNDDSMNESCQLQDIEMRDMDESHVRNDGDGDRSIDDVDPFDQVRHERSSHEDDSSRLEESNASLTQTDEPVTKSDEQQHAEGEEFGNESNGSEQTSDETAGVVEEQRGGENENISLLPDHQRVISEEEKQQAAATEEADKANAAAEQLQQEEEERAAETAESAEAAEASETVETSATAENTGTAGSSGKDINDTVAQQDETVTEDLEDEQQHLDTNEIPDEGTTGDNEPNSSANDIEVESEPPTGANQIRELAIPAVSATCAQCKKLSPICVYSITRDIPPEGESQENEYICSFTCVQSLRTAFPGKFELIQHQVGIYPIFECNATCKRCSRETLCKFRYRSPKSTDNTWRYLCEMKCVQHMTGINSEKFCLLKTRYTIEEKVPPMTEPRRCIQCFDNKPCQFAFKQDDDELFICQNDCLNLLMKEHPQLFRLKRYSVRVRTMPKATPAEQRSDVANIAARTEEEIEAARAAREASFQHRCYQCSLLIIPGSEQRLQWEAMDFCGERCLASYQNSKGSHCVQCQKAVTVTSLGKYCVRFGFKVCQFCSASCLDTYKKQLKNCCYCQRDISTQGEGVVVIRGTAKGTFREFCNSECHQRYKYATIANIKKKPQICSVCNHKKPTSVVVRLETKEHYFCSSPCFSAFKFVSNITPDECAMCGDYFERQSVLDSYTIFAKDASKKPSAFCTQICMNLYISKNRIIDSCSWCKVKKYNFDMIRKGSSNTLLCSLNCLQLSQVSMNAIAMKESQCDHCGVLKTPQYHLTMSDASLRDFCTYQCVMLFQSLFGKQAAHDGNQQTEPQEPVPTGLPKRVRKLGNVQQQQQTTQQLLQQQQQQVDALNQAKAKRPTRTAASNNPHCVPVIASVHSLASSSGRSVRSGPKPGTIQQQGMTLSLHELPQLRVALEPLTNIPATGCVSLAAFKPNLNATTTIKRISASTQSVQDTSRASVESSIPVTKATTSAPIETSRHDSPSAPVAPTIETHTQIVTIPPIPVQVANIATMCKPKQESKGVSCRPVQCDVGCQTESWLQRKLIIPIPVPMYVPVPMFMYSMPTPVPVPIPLPIPVPVFIPTTRNSANGILKEIKKIQEKLPTDPYEAELLMMAEMVAGEKKKEESDSDSDDGGVGVTVDETPFEGTTHEIEHNTSFSEDLVQMALKMASSEYEDSAVDLESAMQANTISQQQQEGYVDDPHLQHHQQLLMMDQQQRQTTSALVQRGRKRTPSGVSTRAAVTNNNSPQHLAASKRIKREHLSEPSPEPVRVVEPMEKPDANMCLKYTFGVNAWKQWVLTKNAELEKSSVRRKPFKSDILQLTADELSYSLCLFVKEVRKPNGTEYAPDTIYYLVLGIQQYLFEKGRVENIFTDPYYERFTDCLDEVAKKFSVLYNDSQFIVTRVEEEHLWECKQLGAHSPHVLLSTLMFFNTKHFNLVSVDEHMELSFSHIMKHWKRNPSGRPDQKGNNASRNVLLRFYPPQSSLSANARKKKVYEQQENEENPLRCPVKLYEFYLSKCPESVKTRNDVFYLQPERSCVPDSPVWYSTQPLSKEALSKMLHRVKMVKEINIALLTS